MMDGSKNNLTSKRLFDAEFDVNKSTAITNIKNELNTEVNNN